VIKVYKSDTGQFVLVHAPTQTFIIDENLDSAYAKLEAHVGEAHPGQAGAVLEPVDRPFTRSQSNSRIASLILVVFLALLPFVWLVVMHRSLAALITEFRVGGGAVSTVTEEEFSALRQDLDFMRFEQNRMLEVLHALTQVQPAAAGASEDAPAEGETTESAAEGAPEEQETDAAEANETPLPDAAPATADE
jgi:hypothetical protein